MSRERIKHQLWSTLHEWVDSLGDKAMAEAVIDHCFIAGGAISSLVRGEPPVNDYDIYFTDVTVCQWVVDLMVNHWNEAPGHAGRRIEHYKVRPLGEEPDRGNLRENVNPKDPITPDTPKYAPVCFTPNAITLNNQIQLITRFIGEPDEIVKRFDFAHTQCYYRCFQDTLYMAPQALESMASHELIYTGSDYPLSSIIRTKKYIQRGWSINAGQYLKMALQLHALDFTKAAVLADQLVGVDLAYFSDLLNTIRRLEKNKEGNFSLSFEGTDKAPTNFYDPFYADDEKSIGSHLLDTISRLWD